MDAKNILIWYFLNSTKWCAGKTFHYGRGVLQGDPVSPLLFVLAADLLQSVINEAKDSQLSKLPIPLRYSEIFCFNLLVCRWHSHYHGRMPKSASTLIIPVGTFPTSTDLNVNYSTSMMAPINISEQRCLFLAETFGSCYIGSTHSHILDYRWV